MAKASKIIKLAKSYVGTKESPAYSNNVIFNTHYYGHPVNGYAYAWCATFVWDIFRMAGASNLFYDGKKTAWCDAIRDWAKNRSLVVNKNSGKEGDIVLFDWNLNGSADHVGFIVSKNADGTYQTVEGNTSYTNNSNGGEVQIRTRSQDTIMMIIRPKYEPEEVKTSPTPTTSKGVVNLELSKLYKGNKNSQVKAMQILLIGRGYSCGSMGADGDFGQKTYDALVKFQKAMKIDADGICGIQSWTKLLKG